MELPHAVKVFLLDDHAIVRRGLQDLLQNKRDISVVGESSSAVKATDMILALRPDVMLLDVHLPDGSGVTVCRQVRSVDPAIEALLLTAVDDEEALLSTVLAGADGYVLKEASNLYLVGAIRRLALGEPLVDPETRQRLLDRLARLSDTATGLTVREERTLAYIVDGLEGRRRREAPAAHEPELESEIPMLIPKLVDELSRDEHSGSEPATRRRRS